ncbi:coiled-coil domain-containing protein 130 homolog [Leguminivora glycinivorella]|uniref:coiled-coil domain-containing protein 130 homolog n=1 Tax=Leguminivora glycinivorella TaxID=1035111 RepID=UPI0020100365|nr:coiled-coil domain-containing protein 130 homolog [Leguminivora glycinivorella]
MGERKGQNLYYPPDYDPKVGGLNKFLGTHALRERARKLHMGILIIRFEMPYNIWCDGCNNHIGMGVRYNAEKTKIGMYYTTPVYQFRMKCHLCDNHFEIKTDPGNLDYVIVSGARRQENRWDPTENGQVVPETKETQKKLFDDAMFRLEHKTGDEDTAKQDKPRLGRLVGRNESVWKDDYEANCSLRRNFRKRRKELEESAVNDSLLLARSSLDINLLPESEEDRHMATLLSLRPSKSIEEKQTSTRSKILNSPALPSSSGLITSFGGLKKEESLSKNAGLSRNALGIMIKRKKVEDSGNLTKVENSEDVEKRVESDVKKSGKDYEDSEVISKGINIDKDETIKDKEDKVGFEKEIDTKNLIINKNNEELNDFSNEIFKDRNETEVKIGNEDIKSSLENAKDVKVSLVGDYSSSGDGESD